VYEYDKEFAKQLYLLTVVETTTEYVTQRFVVKRGWQWMRRLVSEVAASL
jgi:hypothetical protein